MVLKLTDGLILPVSSTEQTTTKQLCALKIAQDELEWDKRSQAFDSIAKEEVRAGRAQEAGIRDPVSSL